ncbi:MAG: hypothetical protein JSV80_05660 [Acidobacteriota bacterium]|nr:MAG: hypothetical protein JSV80_05660 [Acidobacteriota bacterium]
MSPGRLIDELLARPYEPPEMRGAGAGGRARDGAHSAGGPASEQMELERVLERGYEEGVARGLAEANQRLEQQLAEWQQALAEALGKLAQLEVTIIDRARRELPALAFEIAGRILRRRLDDEEPLAARAAEEVLERLGGGARCKLRLHPADRESVLTRCPSLACSDRVEIVVDESVGRAGVIAETEAEEIDARLETAYRAAWEALMEER